jgi:threonine dehydratase
MPYTRAALRHGWTPAWAAEVFFKCENFQRMGAFKFRGAFNALSRFEGRRSAGPA